MSQVNNYAGSHIAGAFMSDDDAARMLQDLLHSVASIQAQGDEPPQSPWAATSVDTSSGSFSAPDVQAHVPLDHSLTQTQHASTLLHPIDGIPCEPSYYTQHANQPSFQIPHATSHPSWPNQGIPPSTVAPQDTWVSKSAPETLTGLPSYQGRSAIGIPPPSVQPQPAFCAFATRPGLQTVPPQFEQGTSAQYPYHSSAPQVSRFRLHISSSQSRDGQSGPPICPPSLPAMKATFSVAPTVSTPPPKATASPSCAGPSAKPIYLPPTYDRLQGKKVHEFRSVSIDSAIKAARTPTEGKVFTPVNNDWLKTDLFGRVTFYDPHHPMAQPIPFGTQLRLCEDTKQKGHPERYICNYKNPAAKVKKCGHTFGLFSNWQRHFGSIHVKDERGAINRGDLDVSRAVAVKHGNAAIQVIECCTCKWRSKVGDRLDVVWKRHLMSKHGLVLEKKDDKPPAKKRARDESDDEPPVNKKPRHESKDRPSVNKKPRRESKGRPSVKEKSRGESNSNTQPLASGTELEGPPPAKNRRTQKRR